MIRYTCPACRLAQPLDPDTDTACRFCGAEVCFVRVLPKEDAADKLIRAGRQAFNWYVNAYVLWPAFLILAIMLGFLLLLLTTGEIR